MVRSAGIACLYCLPEAFWGEQPEWPSLCICGRKQQSVWEPSKFSVCRSCRSGQVNRCSWKGRAATPECPSCVPIVQQPTGCLLSANIRRWYGKCARAGNAFHVQQTPPTCVWPTSRAPSKSGPIHSSAGSRDISLANKRQHASPAQRPASWPDCRQTLTCPFPEHPRWPSGGQARNVSYGWIRTNALRQEIWERHSVPVLRRSPSGRPWSTYR